MRPTLPHGPAFIFLDSIQIDRDRKKALACYDWKPDHPLIRDHFPGHPIVPAALLIESAAQAAGSLWMDLMIKENQPFVLVAQVERFRFFRPVCPPERVTVEVQMEGAFQHAASFAVVLRAQETTVARGKILLARGYLPP
ncbi:3-hydroxyacyl-ACP dehydratase FabZ family protein [Candidatus Methylacidithermus pantelleriae]|uniref:(3R)-hydroxymyristoyl-(Acyl carrier protein) dehydratase n=1 Tax=Candidatus Methylacidithermus pantelleriae TaxID=2744239 RepID=A0A8J2BM53_9BACT|nr:hotdog domain-containing protein [Candidatus Methylacidithermus pantelleriae]CAF0698357.1 (3R)-hydroxymyristoyl-(acyl carrier protein) dehydratase [Candidatus Methylacidithermus pantelleriae]